MLAGLLCLASLCSCERENFFGRISDDSKIQLVASLPGTLLSSTRASGQENYKGIISSSSSIDEGLVLGVLRIDQTRASFEADSTNNLNYRNVNIVDGSFNPKDYTFTDAAPHYYCSKANMAGDPGIRYVNFDVIQYFKDDNDIVHYYAWYPYGTPVTSASEPFKVNFNLDGKTDVLYSGIATQKKKGESDTLPLKHALCQMRIWVYRMAEIGEDGHSKASGRWGRITSIVSNGQNDRATFTLPSTLTYSASTTPAPNFDFTTLPAATIVDGVITGAQEGLFFATQETVSGVTKTGVEIPLGSANKKQIACYLAPPPTEGEISLNIHTDATEGEELNSNKRLSVAGNFQPGKAYDVVLCFSDHGVINAFTKTTEWIKYGSDIDVNLNANMYYDLSRYGSANTYIVSSGNTGYSFKGNVKGCGNEKGGGSIVGVDDCSLPADSYVEVIYQSTPNLIRLDANRLVDGDVLFWVPGVSDAQSLELAKKGNAIIALKTKEDGDILWSWHIWVTDRPHNQGYQNGYDVMDRNLGALTGPRTSSQIQHANDSSYGFYYQWGRKDPMIPGTTTWSTAALADTNACIAAGIANPLVMYSNWDVDPMMSIMGYRNAQSNVKSIYDPCPPGYRAPESEAFKTLSTMKRSISTGVQGGAFSADGHNYFFYPDAGFVSAKSGYFTNAAAIAATGANDGNGEIYLYTTAPEDFVDGHTGSIVKIADLPTGSQASHIDYHTNQAASAFSMRCISMESVSRVTNLCEAQTANCYIVPDAGAYKFRVDIKGNGVNSTNIGGSMWNINENRGIEVSGINHVAVLWWQGDLSGRKANNTKGQDCPIKFVNEGRVLPRTPAHNTADFGSDDITVPDEDGYVQFYIEEGKWGRGNAVIAAFDAGNNVLWSWHIWLTEEPGKVNMGPWYSSTDNYTYEYTMMDRNLGATYHPTASEFSGQALTGNQEQKTLASVGMYYQWGRKDPIQGAATFAATYTSSSSTASQTWYKRNTSGGYGWSTQNSIEVAEAETSMSVAQANPSVFYKNTQNATTIIGIAIDKGYCLFEKNWYSYRFGCNSTILDKIRDNQDAAVDQWEINKFIGLWGLNTQSYDNPPYEPIMTKTMFDPCPPGYYIPPASFLTASGITTAAYGNSSTNKYDDHGGTFVWSEEDIWTAGAETYGVFINQGTSRNTSSRTFVCDNNIWIPFGGYRDYESGKFNTARIDSSPSAVWFVGQDFVSNVYKYYAGVRSYVITRDGAGQMRGIRPADAANVRCRAY